MKTEIAALQLSVAPMMDWTTSLQRRFMRLLTRQTVLYTEMVTTGALLHGDVARHLHFVEAERPLVLQLGGADPAEMAEAACIARDFGYGELNINVGCPSDRVQSGRFGACLMAEPDTVGRCVQAMQAACALPVTVKCRVGIDRDDSYTAFADFVERVSDYGCQTFIVHARKAWLDGLSPKENREIPPLRYEFVYRLREARPDLQLHINGGFTTVEAVLSQSQQALQGVMLGRAAYQQPMLMAELARRVYGEAAPESADAVVMPLYRLAQEVVEEGQPLWHLLRHVLGLFHGGPGARQWRRHLSQAGARVRDPEVLLRAYEAVQTARQ